MSTLPAINVKNALDRLKAARAEIGSGTSVGGNFLKLNDRTGELKYGQEGIPVPKGSRWVVGLHSFRHGYIDWQDGKPKERNIISMLQGPRPVPKGGSVTRDVDPATKQLSAPRTLGPGEYGTYEGGGPQDTTEIDLQSIEEKGFSLTFSPGGKSSTNSLGKLLEHATAHIETPDGAAGYVHPVIEIKAGVFKSTQYRRDVYFFDWDIVDWLHQDGEQLLSKHGGAIEQKTDDDQEPPWGDDDLTDEEKELLRA